MLDENSPNFLHLVAKRQVLACVFAAMACFCALGDAAPPGKEDVSKRVKPSWHPSRYHYRHRGDGGVLRNVGSAFSNGGSTLSNDGSALRNDGSAFSNDGSALSNDGSALSNDGSALIRAAKSFLNVVTTPTQPPGINPPPVNDPPTTTSYESHLERELFEAYSALGSTDPGRGHPRVDVSEDTLGQGLPHDLSHLLSLEITPLDFKPRAYAMEAARHLTLEDMRLCEVVNGGSEKIKHGQKSCPGDPTCLKCVPVDLLRSSVALLDAYQDPVLFERRRSLLMRLFPPPSAPGQEPPLVVMASDIKYMDMVLNWLCHAERQLTLKDLRARLLIVSLDEVTTSLCRLHGLKFLTFYDALPKHAARNLRGLPWAMSQLVMGVTELVHLNHSVLMQDSDLVWLKDPLPFLHRSKFSYNMDILGQLAPRWDAQGQMNTGFVFVRSNSKTKAFMSSIVAAIPIMAWAGDDQVVWNHLLRLWVFRQLHWQLYPSSLIMLLHQPRQLLKTTMVAHMVSGGRGTSKRDRLRDIGGWVYNTSECPIL